MKRDDEVVQRNNLQPTRRGALDALLARPVTLWLLYLSAVTLLAVSAKALIPELLPSPAGVSLAQVTLQLVMLLMVLLFAVRVGARRLGLSTVPVRSHSLLLLFPIATIAFGYTAGFREIQLSTLLLAIASVALVGITEELAFRGVLLPALLPRGVWAAVAISSALFGLLHLANLALGATWQTTLLQVTFAAMAGAGYAAMRLRTGSLWPPIVLHALYDLTFRVGLIEAGSWFANSVHMLHGVGWAIYAVIVLRTSKRLGLNEAQ